MTSKQEELLQVAASYMVRTGGGLTFPRARVLLAKSSATIHHLASQLRQQGLMHENEGYGRALLPTPAGMRILGIPEPWPEVMTQVIGVRLSYRVPREVQAALSKLASEIAANRERGAGVPEYLAVIDEWWTNQDQG